MKGRRLSLRARMLILLIGVTAVFLLIMGAVTTAVLTKRVGNAFNADLIAAAAQGPARLADNASGYLAVAVSARTGQVVPLTGAQQTSELGAVLSHMTQAHYRAQFGHGPTTVTLADGEKLRAVRRYISGKALASAGFAGPAGAYILVVAHSPDAVNSQVSGVLVAELITGGALLALLAIGGVWLIGRGLEPLDQMASTANEITSRGDLTARVADADDRTEVGRLGRPSTPCSTGSSRRSARGCAPSRRCASSPRTPRTSYAPR
jgi:two-component system OmpR family sensor kinase